ncbi:MAG TPA: glucose-6-phosphate dehydrogenase [Candidatus Paceibacterota bacterium]
MTSRPTTIVLIGITGDLARKKLLPALYDLYINDKLENTKIVGFSRREFGEKEIKDFVKENLPTENFDEAFLDLITYVQGQFDDKNSYKKLSEHLSDTCDKELGDCSNKLFYLAVPPNLYETICTNISTSGLSIPCGGKEGFARILIEKPFGKDLETAEKLDELLGRLFREDQIYRIDHYVAKEALLNIINVHRKEESVAHRWNTEHVEKVEIDLFETATVGSRGSSYDGVGAFCDVGQNHLLQMLSLVAMDIPDSFEPKLIQKSRADILEHLVPTTEKDIREMSRGQYEGYVEEPGVATDSTTETFFSITVRVDDGTMAGVPFVLKSGKALSENLTQVVVTFKDGKSLAISVPPENSLPAYQKILLDCIIGDQTVFISTREVLAEWKFITPIVEATQKNKPFLYKKGSDPAIF